MKLIVQKYGGSSLASPKLIQAAADRITQLKRTGCDVVVVVSAMGRTTDHLIRLAFKTVAKPSQRELDMLMTAGERVSMSLLAMALHEKGIPAISFTGSQSGIVTTGDHTDAKILEVRATRIQEALRQNRVAIVAGFQGVSTEKEITTLGRGGSDTTAVALTAALKGEYCEVLTDVDGIFTADPKVVGEAEWIPYLNYDEALEMAALGAKMQARSIEMARRSQVIVRVASSRALSPRFTEIGPAKKESLMELAEVKSIATQTDFVLVRVKRKLPDFIQTIQSQRLPLRFFNSNDDGVSFLVEDSFRGEVEKLLSPWQTGEKIVDNLALVSAVGEGVGRSPEVIQTFLETLSSNKIETFFVCSNSLSISAAVSKSQKGVAASCLHEKLVSKKKEPPR